MSEVREFELAPAPTFEELVPPASRHFEDSVRTKGVLLDCAVSRDQPTTVGLAFLETQLHMTHSDLLYYSEHPYAKAGLPAQPTMTVVGGRFPIRIASRYLLWHEPSEELRVDIMIGTGEGDVRDRPRYGRVRRIVALACAEAIMAHHDLSKSTSLELRTRANFENAYHLSLLPVISASCLADLRDQLS